MLDERLADQVWRFWQGEHADVVAWLQQLGCTLVSTDGADHTVQYTLDGLTGIRSALLYPSGDPYGLAVPIGFLVGGPFWATLYPDFLDLVNAKWHAERKAVSV